MVSVRIKNGENGKFSLGLFPGQEKSPVGFPRELLVDLSLFDLTNETIVLAAIFAFEPRLRGKKMTAPQVSDSLVSRMIEAGASYRKLPFLEAADRSLDFEKHRQNTLVITFGSKKFEQVDITGPGRRIDAHLLDFSDWTGRLFGPNDVYFGTNASLLSAVTSVSDVGLRLAIAMLMANDWRIGKVVLPDISADFGPEQLRHYRAIISSVGIELEIFTESL